MTDQSMLSRLIHRLRLEEGWRSSAYIDTKGYITIGYGFNLGYVGKGVAFTPIGEISPVVGEQILLGQVLSAIEELRAHLSFWDGLDPVRQVVLADLYFNMGLHNPTGFVAEFEPTLSLVEKKEYAKAAQHMRGWKWYDDVGPRRAEPLIEMMRTGMEVLPR